MKFLITGVSGFVGEELVYYLLQNPKYSILGIDKNKENISSKIIFKQHDHKFFLFQFYLIIHQLKILQIQVFS